MTEKVNLAINNRGASAYYKQKDSRTINARGFLKRLMTTKELEQRLPGLRTAAMRTAERFFGEGEEAEDVAQECCIRLWMRHGGLRSEDVEGLARTMARTMARNLCVSELRKRKKVSIFSKLSKISILSTKTTKSTAAVSPPEISHERTPAAHAIENENQRLLAEALAKLPPAWQRIIRMQSETEMTTGQMAVVLGIMPESVSAMLSAARRRLYEILKDQIQR